MTTKQKKAIALIVAGGYVSGSARRIVVYDKRRIPLIRVVYDKRRIPLIRLHEKTFDAIKTILKKSGARWVLSVAAVRRQRKNSFAKKLYLKTFNEKKLFNAI